MKKRIQKFLRGPIARLFARSGAAGATAGFEYIRTSSGSDYRGILYGALAAAGWAAFEYFTPANAAVGARTDKQVT